MIANAPIAACELFAPIEWQRIAAALSLSGRELEIVQLLFRDRKELAMAYELGISVHTVHTHLDRLYRKLDVAGRCAALLRIFETFRALSLADAAVESPARRGRNAGSLSHLRLTVE
ncbi:MAG: helix-turn-helix transcriptional regulator [Phycisphaerae bacterium]